MPSIYNKNIARALFIVCALACTDTALAAKPAQNQSIGAARAPTVGATTQTLVATNLNYAAPCAAKSVLTGLFVRNGGQWEDHNRCYSRTNANRDPAWRNSTLCMFKYPLAVNKPRNEVLFRVYNVDSSCRYQSTYTDYHPFSNVVADSTYDDVRADGVTIQNATSRSVIDRNGGTTYEYYSLRGSDAGLRAGTFENAIHAHFGAALQTVLFGDHLTFTPCDVQGVWNPTQAGAACGTSQTRACVREARNEWPQCHLRWAAGQSLQERRDAGEPHVPPRVELGLLARWRRRQVHRSSQRRRFRLARTVALVFFRVLQPVRRVLAQRRVR